MAQNDVIYCLIMADLKGDSVIRICPPKGIGVEDMELMLFEFLNQISYKWPHAKFRVARF